jgi:mRNA-degrading endonuclease RelE of RelBE toxin-antitoxin system
MPYRLLVSIEVIEFIERLPGKTRESLRRAIHAIGRDPLGRSDALDHDVIGRRIQIAVVGDYALMYWVDEADQHIKILDIHASDR